MPVDISLEFGAQRTRVAAHGAGVSAASDLKLVLLMGVGEITFFSVCLCC